MIGSKVGLAVMRIQPLHGGHCHIINRMIQDCETVILGLGSTNKKIDRYDPFTADIRMQMVRNVYGDRVKIVPLADIEAATRTEWVEYIFEKLSKLGMREPTDYYTGSLADANFYIEHFQLAGEIDTHLLVRSPQLYHKETDVLAKLQDDSNLRRRRILNLLDRTQTIYPSASELRTFIELRSIKWREWVPNINHSLVEGNYPEEFLEPDRDPVVKG